ncbi:MAG: hypothetical protein ACMXX8_00580 [Candidatus Woesearchaeota archaeon]
MDLKNIINEIETNNEYINWKNKNKETYLVHIFKMIDDKNKNEIQVGYYNKENKMITTFVFNEKTREINQNPESEAYREKETHIEKLNLDDVKIDFVVLMNKIENLRKSKYKEHLPNKSFFILQNINNETIWNFTIIAKTLNIVNIKINANNGNVIEDKLTSIFDFKVDK